jgi:hypothetical protein
MFLIKVSLPGLPIGVSRWQVFRGRFHGGGFTVAVLRFCGFRGFWILGFRGNDVSGAGFEVSGFVFFQGGRFSGGGRFSRGSFGEGEVSGGMDDVFQEGEVFGRLTRQETTIELPPNDFFGISEVFACGCDPSW